VFETNHQKKHENHSKNTARVRREKRKHNMGACGYYDDENDIVRDAANFIADRMVPKSIRHNEQKSYEFIVGDQMYAWRLAHQFANAYSTTRESANDEILAGVAMLLQNGWTSRKAGSSELLEVIRKQAYAATQRTLSIHESKTTEKWRDHSQRLQALRRQVELFAPSPLSSL
jgi:hypothetical protein